VAISVDSPAKYNSSLPPASRPQHLYSCDTEPGRRIAKDTHLYILSEVVSKGDRTIKVISKSTGMAGNVTGNRSYGMWQLHLTLRVPAILPIPIYTSLLHSIRLIRLLFAYITYQICSPYSIYVPYIAYPTFRTTLDVPPPGPSTPPRGTLQPCQSLYRTVQSSLLLLNSNSQQQ